MRLELILRYLINLSVYTEKFPKNFHQSLVLFPIKYRATQSIIMNSWEIFSHSLPFSVIIIFTVFHFLCGQYFSISDGELLNRWEILRWFFFVKHNQIQQLLLSEKFVLSWKIMNGIHLDFRIILKKSDSIQKIVLLGSVSLCRNTTRIIR